MLEDGAYGRIALDVPTVADIRPLPPPIVQPERSPAPRFSEVAAEFVDLMARSGKWTRQTRKQTEATIGIYDRAALSRFYCIDANISFPCRTFAMIWWGSAVQTRGLGLWLCSAR
jgi:hypothetical protein